MLKNDFAVHHFAQSPSASRCEIVVVWWIYSECPFTACRLGETIAELYKQPERFSLREIVGRTRVASVQTDPTFLLHVDVFQGLE
jgi:hypothetical protein